MNTDNPPMGAKVAAFIPRAQTSPLKRYGKSVIVDGVLMCLHLDSREDVATFEISRTDKPPVTGTMLMELARRMASSVGQRVLVFGQIDDADAFMSVVDIVEVDEVGACVADPVFAHVGNGGGA